MNIRVFPTPRHIRFGRAVHDFSRARWVRIAPDLSFNLKQRIAAVANDVGVLFPRPLGVTAGEPERGGVFLDLRLDPRSSNPQGYMIDAGPRGIRLRAPDEAGLFYGLETLRQIVGQTGARVPDLRIRDYPDFEQRGYMLDISRCRVPTMSTLRILVETLARLKINHLELYTEHTFAYSAHETVWHDASPMTANEILELDAHCRRNHIELAPNQNSFGHFERWLRHAEYRHLAESPDGFEWPWGGRSPHGTVLRPTRESLAFLDGLYAELLPNFTSRLFNVGCDETWELGKGASRALCERKGTTRVYLDFLLQIHKLAAKHGRTMMFWGDIILHQPELIRELPADCIAMDWGYEANHPFAAQCAHFARSGIPFYVCPGTSSWNSLTGRTSNALGNLWNAAASGRRYKARGYLITDWGDGGHHQYLPVSWLGILAGAAYAWCGAANRNADISAAANHLVFEDSTGILGGLFYELGKTLELVPVQRGNGSIFNEMLFWDMEKPLGFAKDLSIRSLRRCLRHLEKIEGCIADARPEAVDGERVKAELANAIAMTRHAVRRGLFSLGEKGLSKGALRRELQLVIKAHEELWLARNRPGGLRESSGRLRDAMKPLME